MNFEHQYTVPIFSVANAELFVRKLQLFTHHPRKYFKPITPLSAVLLYK